MIFPARRRPTIVAIILPLGFLFTLGLSTTTYEEIDEQRAAVFAAQAGALREEVARRINAIEEAAHGLYTLFHSTQYVDAAQFRLFVENLVARHEHIGGIFYLPRVSAADRQNLEAAMQRAEPSTPSSAALLGRDLASDPRFEAAIDRAIRSGSVAGVETKGAFPLASGHNDFLVLRATYTGKRLPQSQEERVRNANGVVAVWVRTQNLLRYDASDTGVPITVSVSTGGETAPSAARLSDHARSDVLFLGDLPLRLNLAGPGPWTSGEILLVAGATLLGILLTVALVHIVRSAEQRAHSLAQRNKEIAQLVDERTRQLAEETAALAREIAERRRVEAVLRASEANLAHAHRIARLVTWEWNAATDTLQWGANASDVFGLSPEQLGHTLSEYLRWAPAEDHEFVRDALHSAANAPGIFSFEHRLLPPDGGVRLVRGQAERHRDDPPAAAHVVGTLQDITQLRRAEERSRQLSSALEQTADMVMITDREGYIEYVNPAFESATLYTREEVIGRKPNIIKSGRHDAAFYQNMWKTLLAGEVFRDVLINTRKDATTFYEEKTITPIKNARGQITHFISTGKDISERMQTEQRLHFLAHHDVLTALPNRAMLLERLEHALVHAKRHKTSVAVLFLDLDRFKMINDTLGHDIGDRLLMQLADRLQPCLRQEDTVARLGGDEFTVLLENVLQLTDVSKVAGKILDAMARPFVVDGMELFVTGSIGISMYPADGETPQALLKHADTAMYQAKEDGGNTFRFYASDMSAKAIQRLQLETSLRRALARREFVLYYQPLVHAQSGAIAGVEALLRWHHPALGVVPPNDFVPVLEDTGLISAVGEWVLREACQQYRHWRKQGVQALRLSVNLSGRQFSDPGVRQNIGRIIDETEMDTDALSLEITETVIMENADASIATATALSELGVQFAIDDFGTGYSSLSYLRRLPIKTLKIDRSFVHHVPGNSDDAAIVSTIIAMAHSLQLEVIAEGVENGEQAQFLRDCACDYLQGYHYSAPVTAADMTQLLAVRADPAAGSRGAGRSAL